MPASSFIKHLRRKIGNELLQVPTVSVLIFNDGNKALLVRHVEGNRWTTPGGMVEPGETPSDAAVREAWEETGLHVRLDRILGVFGGKNFQVTYANGDKVSFVTTVFVATVIDGEPKPDYEETLELGYFSLDDLARVSSTPHVREFLQAAEADKVNAYFQPAEWSPG